MAQFQNCQTLHGYHKSYGDVVRTGKSPGHVVPLEAPITHDYDGHLPLPVSLICTRLIQQELCIEVE